VREGWRKTTVGEILKLEYGKPLPPTRRKRDGRFPVYGANGEIDRTNDFYYDKPSIIVGRKGSAGELNLTEGRFWALDVTYFVTHDGASTDLRFLYHLLTRLNLPALARGIKPGINRNDVYAKQILVPPLAEQKHIVAFLDQAFEGIEAAKANTEQSALNANELFNSYLDARVSELEHERSAIPLVDLCEADRLITYGVIKLGRHVPQGVPCLRTSNVRRLRVETEGMKVIAPALSDEYSRTILKGGEVLVNVRGTLGGVAVVSKEMEGWNVSREVAVVPVDQGRLNPTFASYVIASGVSQEWLGRMKKGATYVGINIEDLRRLPMPVASKSEQARFVADVQAVAEKAEGLQENYKKKLHSLRALRASYLDKAFNAER